MLYPVLPIQNVGVLNVVHSTVKEYAVNAIVEWSQVPPNPNNNSATFPIALNISAVGPSVILFQLPNIMTIVIDNSNCASPIYLYSTTLQQGIFCGARQRKRVVLSGNYQQALTLVALTPVNLGSTAILFTTRTDISNYDDNIPLIIDGEPFTHVSVAVVNTFSVDATVNSTTTLLPAGASMFGFGVTAVDVNTGVVNWTVMGSGNIAPILAGSLVVPAASTYSGVVQPYVEFPYGISQLGTLQFNSFNTGRPTTGQLLVTVKGN